MHFFNVFEDLIVKSNSFFALRKLKSTVISVHALFCHDNGFQLSTHSFILSAPPSYLTTSKFILLFFFDIVHLLVLIVFNCNPFLNVQTILAFYKFFSFEIFGRFCLTKSDILVTKKLVFITVNWRLMANLLLHLHLIVL